MSRREWDKARYDAGLCTSCREPRESGDHKCTYHRMQDSLRKCAKVFWDRKHKKVIKPFLAWWYTRYMAMKRNGGLLKSKHQVAVEILEFLDEPLGKHGGVLYNPHDDHRPLDVLRVAAFVRAKDRKALNEYARLQANAKDSPPES